MPRGGSRSGKAGTAYSNRTDLTTKPRLPATAVPGQPYGQAGEQLAAQKAIPMGAPALPDMPDLSDHPHPLPGELPPLTAPTARPDEPITHGLPVGLGAGTEVLPTSGNVESQYSSASALIGTLAAASDSPTLATLAAYVRNGL